MSAETGEGAAGNHACSGRKPALAPKPSNACMKASPAPPGPRAAPRMASKVYWPAPACNAPKASRMAPAPTWACSR